MSEKPVGKYTKWGIFKNSKNDYFLVIPCPGKGVSFEGMKSFWINPNRIYESFYYHKTPEAVLDEYNVYQKMIELFPEPTKYEFPKNWKTYEERMKLFHMCMERRPNAKNFI